VHNSYYYLPSLDISKWQDHILLASADTYHTSANNEAPIFITARFRSGSTMLWNIFRHIPGITAYYEPLHPTLGASRIQSVDPTHDFVEGGYWAEYDRIPDIEQWHTYRWHYEDLYLDESHHRPELAAYITKLIDSADNRAALQFNRVDFRVAWLRYTFPQARLIHLFRNPRDQWVSTLRNPIFRPYDPVNTFMAYDHFFLLPWVNNLKSPFPILDWEKVSHPYCMFYIIWKLSYIWGRTYSELSVAYEDLLDNPQSTINDIFNVLGVAEQHVQQVVKLVRAKPIGKWETYAYNRWFTDHERIADELLDSWFLL